MTPEQEARQRIDRQLDEAGWRVQNRDEANLSARRGVAIREFKLKSGHGYADYLLFVDGHAVGVLEAKPVDFTLTGVEVQAAKYAQGLPDELDAPIRPLPFCYLSTGAVTRFTNRLDPRPRSRTVFQIHRPETLAEWLSAVPLTDWLGEATTTTPSATSADPSDTATDPAAPGAENRPSTLRARLRALPPLVPGSLYANQIKAVTGLERSLHDDRPRALIQMATGSGKTIAAITAIYRLIKFGGARRVLFLVDRGNLGEQAEKEFESYRTPDDNRKFTDLYKVQRLTSGTIGASTKVVISTVQRLYSMLKGEPYQEDLDEKSVGELEPALAKEPLPVVYNPTVPPEYFDVIVIDECHRSIYTLWRQVLEYFDAYLIGLTATPAKHTYGFFEQNLVMSYTHEEAVAEGVNVDFEVYRISTKITEQGAQIKRVEDVQIGLRNRQTRKVKWQKPDEDITYTATDLDRAVVAQDQIRTVVKTFKNKVKTEIFPGRQVVPKTLVFAKDDSHAEDIVTCIRQEFAQGDEFCQKITYKTTGKSAKDLIQEFRNRYYPRIAVTVDMIATGTDIKPIEIVMFMRSVKSRVMFEQMKGRGVRTIKPDELQAVTPDSRRKTHFVIIDCIGVTETPLADTHPLERNKSVSFKSLLEHVAMGGTNPEMVSSLASRLARLDKQCGPKEREKIAEAAPGVSLPKLCAEIVHALDPDRQEEKARELFALAADQEPTDEQIESARKALVKEAVQPLATNPKLRRCLDELKTQLEQIIDTVTPDELTQAGFSKEAKEKAKSLVQSFEEFLKEHQREIDALQFFYSQPYRRRLRFADLKKLHEAIAAPPRQWTEDKLWAAYELVEQGKVRGASAERRLTDLVSLIRFALHQEQELVPFAERIRERFAAWLKTQETQGRTFTADQLRWLEMIRDHVAQSYEITIDDFEYTPFSDAGYLAKAVELFGQSGIRAIIDELNEVLVA